MTDEITPGTKIGLPESFGWMRRADLERPDEQIWERPNGSLVVFEGNHRPVIVQRPSKPVGKLDQDH